MGDYGEITLGELAKKVKEGEKPPSIVTVYYPKKRGTHGGNDVDEWLIER